MTPSESAKQKLVHYFEQFALRLDMEWGPQQVQEVESIVDDLQADRPTASTNEQQKRIELTKV